jgi:hypothetical protein
MAMADMPEWKRILREPNALVWIAFLLLAVGIGVGTMVFGGPREAAGTHAHALGGSSAAYGK